MRLIKKVCAMLTGLLFCISALATEYVGTMQMASGYTLNDVRVSIDEKGNLTLYRVKFARFMPIRVDVVIPQVELNSGNLKGDNIIPIVNKKQHPDRVVTKLSGTADSKSISFNCLMGGKGMQYSGKRK